MKNEKKSISIISAFYNEKENLKKFVQLISFEKNYGQQFAIYEALKKNKSDFYGALDSDGQQDAELFIQMIILNLKKIILVD